MAKIVLDKEEVRLFRNPGKLGKEIRMSIYEAAMQIAGDLGGYGIDLVDEDGRDLSTAQYDFSYNKPEHEVKVVVKDERDFLTKIIEGDRD